VHTFPNATPWSPWGRVAALLSMLPILLWAGCVQGFTRLDADTAALRDAAARGDLEGVDAALARGGDVRSLYVLQGAAIHGHDSVIRHLVARGAPVEAPDGWNSHLWFAVVNGQAQAVRTLLELGADPDRASPPEGGPALIELFDRPIDAAATYEIATALLDHGANVNIAQSVERLRSECVASPLHGAVWRVDAAAVDLLLERGADVRAVDGQGRTALACATERRSIARLMAPDMAALDRIIERLRAAEGGGPE